MIQHVNVYNDVESLKNGWFKKDTDHFSLLQFNCVMFIKIYFTIKVDYSFFCTFIPAKRIFINN